MLKSILYRTSIICVSVAFLGCGKDTTGSSTSVSGNEFFISGKGLRRIWTTEAAVVGLGEYQMTDLALTSDGYLHTVYSYLKALPNGAPSFATSYRSKINVATGDTVATTGIPAAYRAFDLGVFTVPCRGFGVVPYTDVFAYGSSAGIEGTPNFQTVPAPLTGFAAIYPDRSYACVTTEDGFDGLRTLATYTYRGISQPTGSKLLTARTLTASMELSTSGAALTFVMDARDSLFVINYASGTRLAGIRLPMISEYVPANVLPNYRPQVFMVTKRNRAGTRVIGLIHNATGRAVSTFVYDIASNTLEAKVQNARFADIWLYLGPTVTFDDVGNVYYSASSTRQQINRITPTGGDVIYRSGFVAAGGVIALKHIDDKLFAVIGATGDARYRDERAKGRMMITVAE